MLALVMVFALLPVMQTDAAAATQLYWPVPGHTSLSQGYHEGNAIDISDGSIGGATVIAAIGGTVKYIYLCPTQHYGYYNYNGCGCNGFGTGLVIAGDDGRTYQYAHMQANSIPSNVYHGAYVSAGQVIGKVGTTGYSSGNHLHFAISNTSNYTDPGPNPANESYIYSTAPTDYGADFYTLIIQSSGWIHVRNNTSKGNIDVVKNAPNDPKIIWHFVRQSDGSYIISNEYDGKYLSYTGLSGSNATVCTSTKSCKWNVYQGSGGAKLKPAGVNGALEVKDGVYDDGTQMVIRADKGTAQQIYNIYKLTNDGVNYKKPAAPAAPTVTVTNAKAGQEATISWTASALKDTRFDARAYKVTITDPSGTKVLTKTGLTATNLKYTFDKIGSYKITVAAVNTKYSALSTSTTKTVTIASCATHSYGAWKTTKAATCTTTGTKTHTCTACGKTETQTIAMLGHNYVDGVCTRCGDVNLAAPTVAISNVASTGKIKLTWNALNGAETYYIYRSTSENGTYSKIGSTASTSYTDKTAKAGTKYFYKVKSVNENGETSQYSDIAVRTCDCAKPVVKATNTASTGRIKLSWSAIDGAKEYYVYRSTGKDGTYSQIGSTTSTSYTDKTAKAGKTYHYKVKAICANTSGNSAYSAIVSRTCDCARPNISIKLSSGHPKLNWDKVTGADKYYVYRSTSKDGTYSKIGSATSTSYTDKTAKAGKTYYYKVKAINSKSAANSAYSLVDYIKAK